MSPVPYFEPTGPTIAIAGATTAPSGIPIVHGVGDDKIGGYMFYNAGAVAAFVAVGVDAAAALAAAVIPTGAGASSKDSYPVPAGSSIFLRLKPSQYVSAITGTSTAVVYATPGRFR